MARLRHRPVDHIEDAPAKTDAIFGADDFRPRPPSDHFIIGNSGNRAYDGLVTTYTNGASDGQGNPR